jgi:hypothetical protein
MKKRTCDRCKKVIENKDSYLKVSEAKMNKGIQRLNHKGDICFSCWEKLIESEGKLNETST